MDRRIKQNQHKHKNPIIQFTFEGEIEAANERESKF